MIHKLNKEDLNKAIHGLTSYNFNLRDENDLFITPDYSQYILRLRDETEIYIRTYIEDMLEYEKSNTGLLYTKEDIPLIFNYIEYINKLLSISSRLIEHIQLGKQLKLSMSKKETMKLAVEIQRNLIHCSDTLLKEITEILKLQ